VSALTIVKKAWAYRSDKFIDGIMETHYPHQTVVKGETLSKAKYALFREMVDVGWEIDFIEVCREFSFRRYPDDDLVRIPVAPVLETLTEKQRHIIGHANGNDSREPGFRDYYCTTIGHPDCEHLVSLGLMFHGRELGGTSNSRYYLLTEAGKMAALSDAVITRSMAETIFKPWVPHLINKDGFVSLEAIKANPELAKQFVGMTCRIYSDQWGYYWRERCAGYGKADEAGIYDFDYALNRTHHCGPEKGIWFELLSNKAGEVAA
jgi:hypothetical protein